MGPVSTELPGGDEIMEPSWIDEWHRVKRNTGSVQGSLPANSA